jgi:hypothetical protein
MNRGDRTRSAECDTDCIHRRLRPWILTIVGALAVTVCSSIAHGYAVTVPDDYPTLQAAADAHDVTAIDLIYVRPGVVEDTVHVLADSRLAIVGLGDSLTRPRISVMYVGGTSYWLVNLNNLTFTNEFHTVGKANIIFESCRIEGGLSSPMQGSDREVAFRHCVVTSPLVFGHASFVDIDSCRFEGGSVRKIGEGTLTVTQATFDGPSSRAAIEGWDGPRTWVENSRISGYAVGIQYYGPSERIEARSNHIEDCDTGMWLRTDWGIVVGNTIVGSTNDGLVCVAQGVGAEIEHNVVLGSGGRGVVLEGYESSESRIASNTVAGSEDTGFELQLRPSPYYPVAVILTSNIGYGNRVGLRASGEVSGLQTSCNDWFANDSAAVVGVAPSATDLFVDPRFCDLDEHDVRLLDESPLVNAPGCGLVGALGVGCANTSTLVTWFTADRTADGVRIAWRLADEGRLDDVWLERAESGRDVWERVSGLPSREGDTHVIVDGSAPAVRPCAYRLVALENGVHVVLAEPIEVSATGFALGPVTPNPGHGPLRIEFSLAREAPVALDVFDLAGRRVASLVQGARPAGRHSIEWAGARAPGLYLVRYRHPGGVATRRVARL